MHVTKIKVLKTIMAINNIQSIRMGFFVSQIGQVLYKNFPILQKDFPILQRPNLT